MIGKVLAAIGGCAVMAFGTGCEEMPPAEVPVQTAEVMPTYEASGQGQWVWTTDYGWVWVPAEAMPYEVRGEPYVYLYRPTLGWTWFASPWGWDGPIGGWGYARPWYGSYWGPRYHAYDVYAPRAVNVAPPAYRVVPGATNVAPPAYRAVPHVAPPAAYRVTPGSVVTPRPMVTPRSIATPRPMIAPRPMVTPHMYAPPHVVVHPNMGFHGGRR
jgi:hypothetical protein